ncbi:hypothetical protein JCM11641_002419 [Rhodosporidiobolus odoratus]
MASSSGSAIEPPWGRLLIAGGVDFATLGRKEKGGKSVGNPERPELASAHVVRKVANVKFTQVCTSHSGCHAVAISLEGQAYLLGRNEHHQLSHPLPASLTVPHLDSSGKPSKTPAAMEPFPLLSLPDSNAPQALKKQKIVSAAVGRGQTILVTENGEAWTAGWNAVGQVRILSPGISPHQGEVLDHDYFLHSLTSPHHIDLSGTVSQCGHPEKEEHISSFKRVKGALLSEKVVSASCGIQHTLFLTESGNVYAVGTGEKGVLGNGKTGEHIAGSKVLFIVQSNPLLVGGALDGRKVVQITSGQQHNIALDDEGYCWAWGFGGLGRLGIGAQQDALIPVQIPQFAGANPLTRCKKVAAGGTNTLFIDKQEMLLLCGKWKTSGDGSAGQPWMTPRSVHELQGYKMSLISAGGVTLFTHARADRKDGELTVAWGQNANSRELALGEGAAKSATKPTRIDYLDNVDMLDIAAGQNTTFFLARPPSTQAAKDEAKAVTDAPAPAVPPNATTAVPAPAPEPSTSSAAASSVDLSGFGFAFGSSAASPAPSAAAHNTIPPRDEKAAAAGISKTTQEAWEGLQRWPEVEHELLDSCVKCETTEEEKGELLECEKCERAYHTRCLDPPLDGLPDGEWFCPKCDVPGPTFPGEDEGKKRKAEDAAGSEASKKQK